jgi:RNA polymerase sigma factor (sigma-70 family)
MSFNDAYKLYYPRLFGFAYHYTLSKYDSEDLVGETFSRFCQEMNKGTKIANIQAWLFKVLVNLLRTSKAHEVKGTAIVKEAGFFLNKSDDPETSYLLKEKRSIIIHELNELPPEEKILLILYNRGFKYEEIAVALEIKPSSVGTTLARAITKFRNELKMKYDGMFE